MKNKYFYVIVNSENGEIRTYDEKIAFYLNKRTAHSVCYLIEKHQVQKIPITELQYLILGSVKSKP